MPEVLDSGRCELCNMVADRCDCCHNCNNLVDDCECCSYCGGNSAECGCNDDGPDSWPRENENYLLMGDGPLFMGVELEVVGRSAGWGEFFGPSWIHSIGPDGSLPSGFEIRSQPMDLVYWTSIRDKVAKTLSALDARGYKSWDHSACGLHIHVPKDAWSTLQVLKLLTLLYGNLTWVEHCGGRRLNNYCSGASTVDPIKKVSNKLKNGCFAQATKYELLNLIPPRTNEFRFFRGTLAVDRFYRNLQFIHALWSYTQNASMADCKTPDKFLRWATSPKNSKLFPDATRWDGYQTNLPGLS